MQGKSRQEPPTLRQTGNLPWSRPQQRINTKVAAISEEGEKLLAFLDNAPKSATPKRELILPTLTKLNEDVKAAFTKGINNVQ